MTKYELQNTLYAERSRLEKNYSRPRWILGQEAVCQIKITWEDECGKQEHVQALQLS